MLGHIIDSDIFFALVGFFQRSRNQLEKKQQPENSAKECEKPEKSDKKKGAKPEKSDKKKGAKPEKEKSDKKRRKTEK